MATRHFNCAECGAPCTRHNSPANLVKMKFCSKECAAKSFTKIPDIIESFRTRLSERSDHKSNGCIIYTGQNNGRYGQIEYRRKTYLAHRASYMVHKGEIPPGHCVCHSCDTPLCINPDHLWVGSHRDNTQDMLKKHRARYNPKKKLTDEHVNDIHKRLKIGESQSKIAKEFGLSQSYVSLLKNGLRR